MAELHGGVDKYKNDIATSQPRTLALRTGGKGDVGSTHVLWEERRGTPDVASPMAYRGRLYLIRNDGIMICRETATGKLVYQERIGAPGGYYASPVVADGRIYTASDRGRVTVLTAGDTMNVLARNDLDEAIFATPAIADDYVYVRTRTKLYGFTEASSVGK